MSINVTSFKLSIDGLLISYTYKKESTTLVFDPKATCELFQQRKMIEGFDLDKNGEPVIYYTENIWGRKAPAFCMWFEFVKSYPFIQRHAEILVEGIVVARETRATTKRINNLLNYNVAA